MAWIEVHQALLTHRKTLRLSRLLALDKWAVVGRLVALWTWALDNAQEGGAIPSDVDLIAEIMGWDGDPETLMDALVSVGFLDCKEGVTTLHDWDDYAGRLLGQRKANRDKQRRWRERQHVAPAQLDVVDVSDDASPLGRNGYVGVTLPLRNGATVPNLTQPIPLDSEDTTTPFAAVADAPLVDGPPVKPKPEPKPRPKNPIWDAVVEVVGYAPATKSESGKFGKAVHDLNAINATPEDIRTRGAHHEAMFQSGVISWPLTPQALVSNWGKLARVTQPPKRAAPGRLGAPAPTFTTSTFN